MLKKIFLLGTLFSCLVSQVEASSSNTYGVGVEGFHDLYREPSLNLTDRTNYGSVTGYYQRSSKQYFTAVDARASYGTDKYQSPSGTLNGVPQWEFELRTRFGLTYPMWGGSLSPYIGLGARYFRDEGKGYLSSNNAQAYDRRIFQFYVPIGASYAYTTESGWTISPQAELDVLAYGNVSTRLTNLTGVQFSDPATNTQHLGFGGRSELMFGKAMENYSFQVGPFIRYWWFADSAKDSYEDASNPGHYLTVKEPQNNRTQIGVAARVLW